ncbi:conserved hypothetical protein [Ricinus communis]|uniref:Uncharacterized protein n=1 Tax=Ricinus communis TaxID=3988 RepID=B9SX68_RICCO|nr:conserved hypothetical protein [Ricinus communis]
MDLLVIIWGSSHSECHKEWHALTFYLLGPMQESNTKEKGKNFIYRSDKRHLIYSWNSTTEVLSNQSIPTVVMKPKSSPSMPNRVPRFAQEALY